MISSSSRFVVEGVFRKSGVVYSFEMVDPVLFVFGFHVLYSRDLSLFFRMMSLLILSSLVHQQEIHLTTLFLKFIISVRGGHYDYSLWAQKTRYTTAWGYFASG